MNTNSSQPQGPAPFAIKDCALIAISTGKKAYNLRELCEILRLIDPGSIYYHFWGSLLQPRFEESEYNNDFASWVSKNIHDRVMAERLAVIDPNRFSDINDLRLELIEIIEQRLDESELVRWTNAVDPFSFIRSQIVVFDTKRTLSEPVDLARITSQISISSIFYHFLESRRRGLNHADDFSAWLSGFGDRYTDLIQQLGGIDPYFVSLAQLRDQLTVMFTDYFKGEQ